MRPVVPLGRGGTLVLPGVACVQTTDVKQADFM